MKFFILISVFCLLLSQIQSQEQSILEKVQKEYPQHTTDPEKIEEIVQQYDEAIRYILGETFYQGFIEKADRKYNLQKQRSKYDIMRYINQKAHDFVKKEFEETLDDFKIILQTQNLMNEPTFSALLINKAIDQLELDREPVDVNTSEYDVLYSLYISLIGEKDVQKIIKDSHQDIMELYEQAKAENKDIAKSDKLFIQSEIYREGLAEKFKLRILSNCKQKGYNIKKYTSIFAQFQEQILGDLEISSFEQEQKKQQEQGQNQQQQQQQQKETPKIEEL